MTTATNIVINDDIPEAHTYSPVSVTLQSTLLKEHGSITAGGEAGIVLGMSLASAKRQTDRIDVRLNQPHEVTDAAGVTTVRDTARFIGQYILPFGMTTAEKTSFNAKVKNLVQHAVISAYVEDRDPMV
jgi:hypothetical protein